VFTFRALAALALSDCGGQSEGDAADEARPGKTTGIAGNQLLGDVAEEDAARGCDGMKSALAARFNPTTSKPELCTLLALRFSSTEARCTRYRSACLQGELEPAAYAQALADFDPAPDLGCHDGNVDWDACTATVAELEKCLDGALGAFDAALQTYTCEEPSDPSSNCSLEIDPFVAIDGIDPLTGQPYPGSCPPPESGPRLTLPARPALPASCQALQSRCPNLSRPRI
jgi:hypothetical protein